MIAGAVVAELTVKVAGSLVTVPLELLTIAR